MASSRFTGMSVIARMAAMAAVVTIGPMACGGVRTASRHEAAPEQTVDPVLVQVVDGVPGEAVRYVSLSVWEGHIADPLPVAAAPEVVESMRVAAASLGATKLYVDRVDSPYRKGFFGFGAVTSGAREETPPCVGAEYEVARVDVEVAATRCLERLQADRPGLAGQVSVVFTVDAFGDVMRAGATAESSRDGQVVDCVLGALFDESFGEPIGLVCRGTVRAGVQ